MQVVLFLSFLIQDILLFVESFLKASLVFLQAVIWLLIDWFHLLLSLSQLVVLNQCLLEKLSEAHTLICKGLNFRVILPMLAHLNVLLQLFNMTILGL